MGEGMNLKEWTFVLCCATLPVVLVVALSFLGRSRSFGDLRTCVGNATLARICNPELPLAEQTPCLLLDAPR